VVEIGGNWVVVGVASGQVNSLANFKVSELDFSEGYDEAPFYEDETAPTTKRSSREQRPPEPRFEFRPEFDEGQSFTSSGDREDSRKTQSSFIPQTNSAKFHKENVKHFLRKILKVGDGNE